MSARWLWAGLVFCLASLAGLGAATAGTPVAVRAHETTIQLGPTVATHLIDLEATLLPRAGHRWVDLEDSDSFSIRVEAGCARLSAEQLSRLFNDRILARTPRALNDVRFEPEDGAMQVRGGVRLWHRVPPFWMPFTATVSAEVDDDGLIHMTVKDEHVLGLPVAGLLDLVHAPLDRLVSLDAPGARIAGDSVLIDTRDVLPGPAIVSRPSSATLSPAGLQVCFAGRMTQEVPADIAERGSYLWVIGEGLEALGQRIAPARLLVVPGGDTEAPLLFRLVKSRAQIAAGQIQLEANGRMIIRPGAVTDP